MTAQIQVLGPVQLKIDGQLVDLRGARQQRLLGVLAIHEGALVSTDRLIDSVWPDEQLPPDPRATLRTYVSRLRGSFDDSSSIESRDGGYALAIDSSAIDATNFEAYLSEADRTSVPSRRADLLGAALTLWSGPALDGFSSEPWARATAARLDELRASTVEGRVRALIDDRQIDLAISELEAAVRTYPHREAPVALLMSALDQRGRRPDALRAYNDYWSRLATDLGIEPGADIVELERRIVAGETAAQAPVPLRGYELGERIGEGAFAIVYRATQPAVGRTVAIKQIRRELANRPEFIRRFEAEAHLVARLEHPRIVPLYDFWREPDSAFLVMRWLRGGSLAQSLLDGPWPVERSVQMTIEIAQAVQAAHQAGVIHRDIKPENVLLDEEGSAYLTDFGIALEDSADPDPDAALSIGSPAYASPEQLRRERVGPASDIWGLGITLFETLTGRLPFAEATTQAELLDAQLHQRVPSVRSFRPDVPRPLDDLISQATAKSPTDRYPSAAAFITALELTIGDSDLAAPSRSRGLSTALPIQANPYKGLRAFDEADARDFHGRSRLIDEIGAQLSLDGPAGRFVLLVGPSGSGKSSAVRAGLIPAMRKGLVGSSADWFYTTMTPGSHPFEELEAALLRVAVNPPSSLLEQLQADDRGLLRASRRVVPDEHVDLVIVMDQFEELFTLCEDEKRRARFLDALTTAVTDPSSPVRIVATLRADFYDRPLEHQSFGSLTRDHTIAVAPLAPDELEHAIVDPAASAGCEFEPGLVAAIVAEVGDQPGALPLLQFALTSMFDRHVSGLLTLDAFRRMGGLTGAIAERAEQLYNAGDAAHQQACHHMFARLVTLGRGAPDTRRRVRRGELGGGETVDRVIATFGAARLLSFDRDGATREPTVELAHEALIRDWPRLRSWLDSDREGLQVHRHLTAASEAWATRGRDLGDLYRGGRLETAATWCEAHRDELNELEAEFLSASSDLQASEQQQEHQRIVRLRALLATVAVIAVMAVIAGAIALVQRSDAAQARDRAELAAVEAERERDRADQSATEAASERDRADEVAQESDIRRLVAEATDQLDGDREVALLMALEAFRREPSNLTLGGLQRVLVGLPEGWMGRLQGRMSYADVARSQNGSTVVAAGELGLDIFDFETRQLVATFDAPNLTTVGISSDGSTIAAGSGNGDWWLLAGPDLTVAEQGNGEIVTAIEFSPTQSTVAFGYDNGDVAVLTNDQPNILGRLEGGVRGIAWRSDGHQVIAGGGITFAARVFDSREGGQIGIDMMAVGGVTDGSTAIGFIGDDALVANGPAVRFDVASGTEMGRIEAVDVRVNGQIYVLDEDSFIAVESGGGTWLADFSSNSAQPLTSIDTAGTAMAIGSDRTLVTVRGGGLQLLDLSGGRVLGAAVPRAPGRKTASISDDGRIVVSGYNGAIIWTSPGPPPVELGRVDANAAQIHGNELWLGTLAEDGSGSYTIWTEGNGFEEERPYPEIASTVGLSPDGSTIVFPTGNRDTALHVVDRETGDEVIRLDELESAIPETEDFILTLVSDIEFSPDGGHMLASTFGGVWGVWDTSTWALIQPIENGTDQISDAAFSPDGRRVASLSIRGLLSLRDATDYSLIADPVAAHSLAEIGGRAISFTKDGRFVVTDGDNGARLWDAATLEAIGSIFPNESEQHSAELARDAGLLATIIGDDVVLWNVNVDSWFEVGCRAVARNMTESEWVQFGPAGQKYEATCESILSA